MSTPISVLCPFLCCLAFVPSLALISCKDQSGANVDWFAAYKVPRLKKSPIATVANGEGFFYLNQNNLTWQLSSIGLSDTNQAIGYTVQQIYDAVSDKDKFYMMYNDQWPSGKFTLTKGHTKGLLVFDQTSGIWLIHSVPKFPPKDKYNWPRNARVNGQSFLCITFNYTELRAIGKQLFYTTPWTYASRIPPLMASQNPELAQVLNGKSVTTTPFSSQATLTSRAGVMYTHFGKSKKWGKELYYDMVAPALQTALYTETWQNGLGDLGSWCTGTYPVHDINAIQLPNSVAFDNSEDHSKWAVSDVSDSNGDKQYVCIGDINRQRHQAKRGGGTMCILNSNLWQIYHQSAQAVNPCTNSSLKRANRPHLIGL